MVSIPFNHLLISIPESTTTAITNHEEEDLIDYSEDEDLDFQNPQKIPLNTANDSRNNGTDTYPFFPPCIHPDICFYAKFMALLLDGYEGKYEELHHQSLSQPADTKLETADEQEGNLQVIGEAVALDEDNPENDDDFDLDLGGDENEDRATTEDAADEFDLEHENFQDERLINEGVSSSGSFKEQVQLGHDQNDNGEGNGATTLDEDEIDYEDEEIEVQSHMNDIQSKATSSADQHTLSIVSHTPLKIKDGTKDNLDLGGSESTGSENTLEASTGLDVENDEIDYNEDDDAATVFGNQKSAQPTTVPTPTITTGKRTRSDEAYDEDTDSPIKEAKRPRS
jgi:hypothetical protein